MTGPTYTTETDGRTVLLIGDALGILKRIAFALQRRGYSVIWGDSGGDGLRVAETEEPQLIVCETGLSDGSGIDICRTLKGSFFGGTPLVLVGKVDDEKQDLLLAFEAGADDYIGSFTDWQLVMAKLEWLISRRIAVDTSDTVPFNAVYNVSDSLN